jgi:hypothetical protein
MLDADAAQAPLLFIESPWLQLTSGCPRSGHPRRHNESRVMTCMRRRYMRSIKPRVAFLRTRHVLSEGVGGGEVT